MMGSSPDRTVLRANLCTTKGIFTTSATTRRTRCISCMLSEKRHLEIGPYGKGFFFLPSPHQIKRGGPRDLKEAGRNVQHCP